MGIPDHLTCLLRNLHAGQEETEPTWNNRLVQNWERSTSRSIKAVFCHPPHLIYMQSISCEMLGCMNHQLESRLLGDVSVTSDVQMNTTLMAESKEGLNSLLMRVKEESEKAGLRFNIQKTKIMASSPFTSWQIEGETM